MRNRPPAKPPKTSKCRASLHSLRCPCLPLVIFPFFMPLEAHTWLSRLRIQAQKNKGAVATPQPPHSRICGAWPTAHTRQSFCRARNKPHCTVHSQVLALQHMRTPLFTIISRGLEEWLVRLRGASASLQRGGPMAPLLLRAHHLLTPKQLLPLSICSRVPCARFHDSLSSSSPGERSVMSLHPLSLYTWPWMMAC